MCGLRAEVRPFPAAAQLGEDEGKGGVGGRGRVQQSSASPATNGCGAACGASGAGRWSLVVGLECRGGADGSGLVTGRHGGRAGLLPSVGPLVPPARGAPGSGGGCSSA